MTSKPCILQFVPHFLLSFRGPNVFLHIQRSPSCLPCLRSPYTTSPSTLPWNMEHYLIYLQEFWGKASSNSSHQLLLCSTNTPGYERQINRDDIPGKMVDQEARRIREQGIWPNMTVELSTSHLTVYTLYILAGPHLT